MKISVGSNIVAGIYFVLLEIVLFILLGYAIQVYLSCHNLRRLHKGKELILVKNTRLSVVVDYGITTPFLGRAAAITGTTVLFLTIIGSFAIDGSSRPALKTAIAKSVVLHADPEELVDYSKHVSTDGTRVSGTYLLTREVSRCSGSNGTMSIMHSMVAGQFDLDSIVYRVSTIPRNVTCRVKHNGFQDHALPSEKVILGVSPEGCKYSLPFSSRESGVWSDEAQITGCKFQAVQTWCARFTNYVCVTQARHSLGYTKIYAILESIVPLGPITWDKEIYETAADERVLQSLAYLLATGVDYRISALRAAAISFVKVNEPVQILSGKINETDINVLLLALTAGTSVFVTLLLAVLAFWSWRKDVVGVNLRGYNAMNSATNAMVCAASIIREDADYKVPKEGILVGVSRRAPYVGPLRDFEEQELLDDQGLKYEEDEIRGRHTCC